MSVLLTDLWLAVLLSGFFCWVASALIHMLIKYHNADYKKLPNEEAVAAQPNFRVSRRSANLIVWYFRRISKH